MKLGLQTISWGWQIDDLQSIIIGAKKIGFHGLEFAQPVDALGDPGSLGAMLSENGMRPAGLAGGALKDRARYAEHLQPDYLYADEWDEEAILSALDCGMRVGLHPHMYKQIQRVSDTKQYLSRDPRLGLILDTAHMYLAGDNPVEAIGDHLDRILAIHMKDWTDRHGMSPHRFARGFTALGLGQLETQLQGVANLLAESGYDRWVIVEQDTPNGEPMECARISIEWLRRNGLG